MVPYSKALRYNDLHLGPPGGTDLERGYGDVRPWRPPFHASPAARKGPISSKRVSSQDPLLRKFGNFSLYSLNFHPNFSSQAPVFRGKCQFASPTLRKSGPHTPTWKMLSAPPPPGWDCKSSCKYVRRNNFSVSYNKLYWNFSDVQNIQGCQLSPAVRLDTLPLSQQAYKISYITNLPSSIQNLSH